MVSKAATIECLVFSHVLWGLIIRFIIVLHPTLAETENRTNDYSFKMSRRRLLHYWSIDEHYTHTNTTSEDQRKQVLEMALHQSFVHSYNITSIYPEASPMQILANLYEKSEEQQTPFPPMPPSKISSNLQRIKSMFQHAYDSYMHHGYPEPEVKPISCQPGPFPLAKIPAITLIDSLDMLLIMGNYTEFARSVERLRILDEEMKWDRPRRRWARALFNAGKSVRETKQQLHPLERKRKGNSTISNRLGGIFAIDENVSVFETNIRVLGGLLSAHLMAQALFSRTTDNKEIRANPVTLGDVWDLEQGHVLFGSSSGITRETNNQKYDPECSSLGEDMEHSPWNLDSLLDTQFQRYQGLNTRFNECLSQSSWPSEFLLFNQKYPLGNNMESNQTQCGVKESCQSVDSTDNHVDSSSLWRYDGLLLNLAHDMGRRLLPAFNSVTGIPYGTVNLIHGVPMGETPIASLAGAGTLTLEMETLSRLTGDDSFGKAAKRALKELWNRRTESNLLGKHIDINNGQWTEVLSGIGSNSDSFYEYILKHYLLFPEDDEFWEMFQTVYSGIFQNNKVGDWYSDVDMNHGSASAKFFSKLESLMAFYPGLQVLLGELQPSARTTNSISLVREDFGFLPERFSFQLWTVDSSNNGDIYPLRPELIESFYFLHMATKGLGFNSSLNTSGWLWAADFSLHTIERMTRARCGYCTVNGISREKTGMIGPHLFEKSEDGVNRLDATGLEDEMPSFFLSETLKYLYLMFDDSNFLHTDTERAWVLTTEAHPLHWVETADMDERESESKQFELIRKNLIRSLNESLSLSAQIVDEKEPQHQAQEVSRVVKTGNGVYQLFGRILKEKPIATDDFGYFYTDSLELNAASAVHSASGRGDGFSLKPSCSNFGNSNSLWLQSLSGDSLDYNSFYSTSMTEKETFLYNHDRSGLISPLSVSSLYGSNIFEGHHSRCKLNSEGRRDLNSRYGQQSAHSEKLSLGGNLGDFIVHSFVESFGFSVIQISTEEEIRVNFFSDPSSAANPKLVMVDYHPSLTTDASGINYLRKYFLKRISLESLELGSMPINQDSKRKSLVSDFSGHVYVCEIVLKDDDANMLSTVPCTAATFGPSHMKNLIHSDGIVVEAPLNLPELSSDPYGCSNTLNNATESPTENTRKIQLFHRGQCPFEHKASINRPDIAAIIMINNESDRLFLMAGSQSVQHVDAIDSTLTVLISEHDGSKVMELLRSFNTYDPRISALIRVYPHNHNLVTTSDETVNWPKLECREGHVQVQASGGWGVIAMRSNNNNMPFNSNDDKHWQIVVFPTKNGGV